MASDLLSIGASGIRVHQAAIGVISENISNASTDGYNRRSLLITESAVSTASMVFYRSGVSYGGAETGNVVRGTDDYLDLAARQAATAKGRADQRAVWLDRVQTALDDSDLGVGQSMSNMFSAATKLAANPTDPTLRSNLLYTFEQVNTAFSQTSTDLKTIRESVGNEATNEVGDFNLALKDLADANLGLRRAGDGTAAAAQLLDQRDQALAQIAKHVNATISYGANGVANVSYDGQDLVNVGVASTATVTQAADGTLSFAINGTSVATPTTGSLGGLADSAAIVRDRIASLDALATQYVNDVNNWHTAGQTATGAAGGAMLSMSGDASTLQLLITNGADIAGASTSGVANGNLVAISSIRGAGSAEQAWSALIAGHATLTAGALKEQTSATNRQLLADQAREDVSGVNLDREAAELIRLQQAYQASARIIQVARETTQAIFDIF